MSLENDIITLIKGEGFRVTETIRDAVTTLVETVTDENDDIDSANIDPDTDPTEDLEDMDE